MLCLCVSKIPTKPRVVIVYLLIWEGQVQLTCD
jgi:hypothetical protein